VNNVADVDPADPGDAVDRRREPCIAELDPRAFDLRLIRLHGRGGLRHLVLLRLDRLLRDEAFRKQRQVPLQDLLRVGELRLIASFVGDRLVDLRLIRARIDLRHQIAGVHQLALREDDLGDRSCNLTMDRDGVVGLHCAYAAQIDRHVAGLDLTCSATTGAAGVDAAAGVVGLSAVAEQLRAALSTSAAQPNATIAAVPSRTSHLRLIAPI
jgi:hypothetical protein